MSIRTNTPQFGNVYIVADTIADLRQISVDRLRPGFFTIVSGLYARGDGNGRMYVWNPASNADDDGVRVIAPAAGDGRWTALAVGVEGATGPQGPVGPQGDASAAISAANAATSNANTATGSANSAATTATNAATGANTAATNANSAAAAIGNISTAVTTATNAANTATGAATTATTAATGLSSALVNITSRSGWLFPFTDSTNLIVGGWKTDGSFSTALTGNIDTAISTNAAGIASLNTKLPVTTHYRAGYAHVWTDSANAILGGFDNAGDFNISGTNVSQYFRDGGLSPTAKTQVYGTSNFIMFGDSETEKALGWTQLAASFSGTRTLAAYGFGGQVAASINARQGSQPTLLTFPLGSSGFPEIPASGAAAVTTSAAILSYADPSQAKSIAGTVAGISGTLTRAANTSNYTFTRTSAGSVIPIDTAIPFIPDPTVSSRFAIAICWIGTNDLIGSVAATSIKAAIDRHMSYQTTVAKRGIVIMPVWDMRGAAGNTTNKRAIYDALLALVKADYPDRYIDTVALAQRNNDGSANDLTDIANLEAPRSLMADDRHFLSNGVFYSALATAVHDITIRNGW